MLLDTLLCRVQFHHIQPFLDRILEIRLEDLAADLRMVMQAVLRFVGEPWDDAVLDHLSRSKTDDVPPLPWFVGATREQPSTDASGGDWQQRMDPGWIRLVEWLNRAAMERYGYGPAALAREPGFAAQAAALAKDLPGIDEAVYRLLGIKRKLDRHFQNKERLDPQKGLEANVRLNPAAWRYYPGFRMPQVPPLPTAHLALAASPE